MEMKLRATGLAPEKTDLAFAITTTDAQRFLQEKVNNLVKTMRLQDVNQEDVEVILFSTKMTKKFVPFMILLPKSVLKNKGEKKVRNEISYFNPEDSGSSNASVKEPFWNLLKCFIYDKADEQAFFKNTVRQQLGLSMESANRIKANRSPKVVKLNGGKCEYVTCFIDPLRLFHDMLVDQNNRDERFLVMVNDTEQIKNDKYKYHVARSLDAGFKQNKKGKNLNDKLINELNQKIGRR